MDTLTLVIGNKNYSSWSLRPWLLLRQAGIQFTEVQISFLPRETLRERILVYSPSGKVPVLIHGRLAVWESLAICEYLAERFPDHGLWPADSAARALARAVSAEMHAGFAALRQHMPMNSRRRYPGQGRAPGVKEDIDRILQIWQTCRTRYGENGDFLFGTFSIADAMFAPVALRFVTYGVTLNPLAGDYVAALLALPSMRQWLADSAAEVDVLEQYEFSD